MSSRRLALVAATLLGASTLLSPAQAGASAARDPLPAADQIELYQLDAKPGTGQTLIENGIDVVQKQIVGDKEHIELAASKSDLKRLAKLGHTPAPVTNPQGQTQLQAAKAQAAGGFTVWKSYSENGGIADQLESLAYANKDILKLQSIGKTIQGKDILSIKATKNARTTRDGSRPSVLYSATQHAREWIATEVDMRLLKYVVANKDTPAVKNLLATTELWFVPVANPDGYDFTFTEGNRLWRKNLRDNDGDNQITGLDGVDPNRNYPTNFYYDEEGSSSVPSSQTYRGTGPASEPETKAMDGLLRRIGFEFQVNYHSYGPLLLYPIGWQTGTPTADNPVYEALTGNDAAPAVPGFDPDLSAELYTTNGETTDHAHGKYGTLAWTPELEEGCAGCGFVFPDDEALVQAQFEKNLPFALDVAKSAQNPVEPTSHLGNTTPDFVIDPFEVSHGKDQVVQVNAKRKLGAVQLRYSVNNGRTKTVPTREWRGGEKYGKGYNTYYHHLRGKISGTKPGDSVKVWFTARGKTSADFTYKVADDIGGKVLVVAAEDVTGISPAQGVTEAKYADDYATALTAAGYTSDVYDVDKHARKAPHPLGVLSHYKAVIWETGDDIIPRSAGQVPGTASRLANEIEIAMRDYLNEGGKLLHTGKYASYAQNLNEDYFYRPQDPECTNDPAQPCLPLMNDFQQYYLGAYIYFDNGGNNPATNTPHPLKGVSGAFNGFTGTLNGGDSANNQDHTGSFLATSALLPADRFPQFASSAPLKWDRPGAPFDPHTGAWNVHSSIADVTWKRLSKTVDLTGKSSGALEFWTSYDTESHWDHLVVEARTAGQDDWTTLPDLNGHTSQVTGDSCTEGWRTIHPFTARYQGPNCEPTGTSGAWNAASGNSGGWQQWKVDLTPYAGKKVELSISYISDWSTQGAGVFLDDAKVTLDGATAEETSFETDFGGWAAAGAPAGSTPSPNNWTRSDKIFEEGAGIVTEDTVYTGFGGEGLTTQAQRTDLVKRSMQHLLSR
ncbi:M14 family zinc carboxypeptidase [Sinosporangium siamense]|uniref:Zinc carboxypeptidase n=1 Tax=Sinosporangium siamense TaxID=1367973 RepID=A0A919RIY0_9ACTN|nr:M14 family zinc carboxypeptidase [Sinosporangium siamense]GII92724.1 zinc carboxypeptidase [Sinosporangium siamense]